MHRLNEEKITLTPPALLLFILVHLQGI